MQKFLLLFNLFLLSGLPISIFPAATSGKRPASPSAIPAKKQKIDLAIIDFIAEKFTPEEEKIARALCDSHEVPLDLSVSYKTVKAYSNQESKKFIGFMVLSKTGASKEFHIPYFFIDKDYQSNGIGQLLFKKVTEEFCPNANIFTVACLEKSRDFYKDKLGFIQTTGNPFYLEFNRNKKSY